MMDGSAITVGVDPGTSSTEGAVTVGTATMGTVVIWANAGTNDAPADSTTEPKPATNNWILEVFIEEL
jgi:hypothetical protein